MLGNAWTKATRCSADDPSCVEVAFRKSTRSNGGNNCVEVGTRAGTDGNVVHVRDSKDPEGPCLQFTPAEWDAFIGGAKDGEFDLV